MKVKITDIAQKELKKTLESIKNRKPLRIYVAGYG